MPNFRVLKISRKETNTMKGDNLKQPQNKFGCILLAELRGRDTWALPRLQIVLNTQKSSQKKSTCQIPIIIPVT